VSDAVEIPQPSEEPAVDIHKPKPWHNWREFLKEYAIIVIGVLTALAAEQAAEWVHWQGEVQAARASLRAEMTTATSFYRLRAETAACMDKRMETVAALIADAAAARPVDAAGLPFNGMGTLLSDSEWQSERASQTLTHFPREELALMSRFYAQMEAMRSWVYEETTAWSQMAVLLDASQKLSPTDLAQLRVSHHMARRYDTAVTSNANSQIILAAQLGIKPPPPSQAARARACGPPPAGRKY
jgi:hypothetical protein